MVIGLIGGSGSGKSTVSETLRQCGAYVIDADTVAREIVRPGEAALAEITAAFGTQYLLPDGTLNRKKLGELVFSDQKKLQELNRITHPKITERIIKLLQGCSASLAVIDAAVLLDTPLRALCEKIVCVTADKQSRVSRIMLRDRLTREQAGARIEAQGEILQGDVILENIGSLEELKEKAKTLYQDLLEGDSRENNHL